MASGYFIGDKKHSGNVVFVEDRFCILDYFRDWKLHTWIMILEFNRIKKGSGLSYPCL